MKKAIIVIFFLLSGCALNKPLWIKNPPQENNNLYFTGTALGINYEETRDKALKNAFSNIADYLGVKIKSKYEEVIESLYHHVESYTFTKSEAQIQGAFIKETFEEKDEGKIRFFVLVGYPKIEIEKERKRIKEENERNINDVKKCLDNVYELSEKSLVLAFDELAFALHVLDDVENDENLRKKALKTAYDLFSEIKLLPEKNDSSGITHSGLKNPLALKIIRNNKLLSNIPVSFKFIEGRGEIQHKNAVSDDSGLVKVYIKKINRAQQKNMVEATVKLSSLLKQKLEDDATKTASFIFSSEGETVPTRIKLGIAPFENLSKETETNLIAQGLSQIISHKLSTINNLEIVEPTNPEAEMIINGAVYKEEEKFKVIAQIKEYPEKKLIASLEVKEKEVFNLQDALAIQICGALKIDITPVEEDKIKFVGTKNISAYKLFSEAWEYHNAKSWENAKEKYKLALKEDEHFASAANNLAEIFLKEKNYNEAIKHFEIACSINPSYKIYVLNLAIAYHLAGEFEKSIFILNKYLKEQGESSEILLALGTMHREKGMEDWALNYCKKLYDISPNAEICNEIGLIYFKKDELEKAKEFWQEAISYDSFFDKAYNNLGTLYDKKDDYENAIQLYRKALTINFKNSSSWLNLGTAYFKKGLKNAAINAYNNSIKYAPKSSESFYRLAEFFAIQNENDLAIICLEFALQYGYKDYGTFISNPNLKNLKGDLRYKNILEKFKK